VGGFAGVSGAALLRLDVRVADELCPFRQLALDLGGEFVGRIAHRLETERVELFCDVRQRPELDDLAMKQRDDVFRRASWNDEAEPVFAFDVRIARFRHGRNIRQRLRPDLSRDRERPQLAVSYLRHRGRRRDDADRRVIADRRLYREARALERHVDEIETKLDTELLADEMSGRAGSA